MKNITTNVTRQDKKPNNADYSKMVFKCFSDRKTAIMFDEIRKTGRVNLSNKNNKLTLRKYYSRINSLRDCYLINRIGRNRFELTRLGMLAARCNDLMTDGFNERLSIEMVEIILKNQDLEMNQERYETLRLLVKDEEIRNNVFPL